MARNQKALKKQNSLIQSGDNKQYQDLPAFRKKKSDSFFINKLPVYRKFRRNQHFCEIDDFLPMKTLDKRDTEIESMFILSFLISEEYLKILKTKRYPKVIVTDSLKLNAKFIVTRLNLCTFHIHPPKTSTKTGETTFHPKLIILKYPLHIRIMIGTGNLLRWNGKNTGML